MTQYRYKVLYRVRGTDHDGYCSDKNGNTDGFAVDRMQIMYRVEGTVRDLKVFNHTERGCTSSGGSGCCKNFRVKYKAVAILGVKEIKPRDHAAPVSAPDE